MARIKTTRQARECRAAALWVIEAVRVHPLNNRAVTYLPARERALMWLDKRARMRA